MIQNQQNINMAKMLITEHRLTVYSLSIFCDAHKKFLKYV